MKYEAAVMTNYAFHFAKGRSNVNELRNGGINLSLGIRKNSLGIFTHPPTLLNAKG
jgi:hypothetical protein